MTWTERCPTGKRGSSTDRMERGSLSEEEATQELLRAGSVTASSARAS